MAYWPSVKWCQWSFPPQHGVSREPGKAHAVPRHTPGSMPQAAAGSPMVASSLAIIPASLATATWHGCWVGPPSGTLEQAQHRAQIKTTLNALAARVLSRCILCATSELLWPLETKYSVFLFLHFHTLVERERVTNQVRYSESAKKRLAVAMHPEESARVAPTSATATRRPCRPTTIIQCPSGRTSRGSRRRSMQQQPRPLHVSRLPRPRSAPRQLQRASRSNSF